MSECGLQKRAQVLASAQERRQVRVSRAVRAPQRGLTALRPGEPAQALELRQVLAASQPDEPAQAQRQATQDAALRRALLQALKVTMAAALEQVLAQQDARRRTAACCSDHGSAKTSALKQAPEQPVVAQPAQRALRGAA